MMSWKHEYFGSGGRVKFALIIRNFALSSNGCLKKHNVYRMQPKAQISTAVPTTKLLQVSIISGALYIGVVNRAI